MCTFYVFGIALCSYVMDFNLRRLSDYGLVNINIPTNGAEINGVFGVFTSLGGLSDSTSLFTSQRRRDDLPSSQAPYSLTADPSATTSTVVRRPICGKKTILFAKFATGGKLSVTFDAAYCQPICVKDERFNNEIGYVMRHHGIFHHKEWRLVPEDERAPLREYLLDDVEMAKRIPHPDLKKEQQKDWVMLCDHWSFEKFKEWSVKNIKARSKRKWGSRNGSVSTPQHHIRREKDLKQATGQIETWR
ncbi:hypothetical protein TorRG33x02_032360 [Trema orientale]|uniref:Uncharacterized protein n=1 Tax=Trema orientale TaxID=63057 RepID=A0A2P5FTC9_TREOI|nr:hypothetical protein TorRG33x02_032360 [Trema orientale]